MSQPNQPPERPAPTRLWGIPTWGWVAIAAAGGVIVLLWWRNRQSTASTSTTPTATTAASGNDIASELSVLETQIQSLQGQNSQPITNNTQPTSNVKGGWHVYNYLNDLQSQYPGISLDNLLSWNPGLNNNIDYSKPNDPTFKSDTSIRVVSPQITTSAQTGH